MLTTDFVILGIKDIPVDSIRMFSIFL